MRYLLFGQSFSHGNIDMLPNKAASRLHDMHFVLFQSSFSHGKVTICTEKNDFRLDDMQAKPRGTPRPVPADLRWVALGCAAAHASLFWTKCCEAFLLEFW